MTHNKSIEKVSNVTKLHALWEEAITEAEQSIRELKNAIKVFKKHRDAGDEWPGFKRKAGTEGKSVPA